MSTITRKGLEFIVNQIGKAKFAYKDLVGDLTYVRGHYQDFEKNLLRLKGSVIFNDYDLSKKDPDNLVSSEFNTFDSTDNVAFGIQGGSIGITSKISSFFNAGPWTPQNFSPPSMEGWFVYDYNAWSNYLPTYDSNNQPNTDYVVYSFPFVTEPNSGAGRTLYDYPIRYDGISYSRVPLFESARWISVKNNTGSSKNECRLTIPKSYFSGAKHINPSNNKPVDLGIYSHRFLISDQIDSTLTLAGSMGIIGTSDILERLAYKVEESSATGSTTAKIRDYWTFDINLPASSSWTSNNWLHLGFYWSTHDTEFLSGYPSYTAGTATTFNSSNLDNDWFIFPRKNYFDRSIKNFVSFTKTGVNDSNIYLFSGNKSNNEFTDQRYVNEIKPFRYKINEDIINSSTGSTNSFQDMISVDQNEFIPALIATSNKGFKYDDPNLDLEVFFGVPVPLDHIPDNWSDFENYPALDEKYDTLFRLIFSNPGHIYSETRVDNLNGNFSNYKASIVYIEEVSKNVFSPNINSGEVIKFFLPAELRYSTFTRNDKYDKIFDTIGLKLIPYGLRFDTTKIKDLQSLSADLTKAQKSIHNLAKYPMDSLLSSESEPIAIQFSIEGSDVINSFSNEESSKVFVEYDSNKINFEDIKLKNDTEFEIYQPKSNTELLNNTSGTKLYRDYSFRLKFKNKDSVYLYKDLFINASSYLISDEEYADRISKNLSINGYYRKSDLEKIKDYKLYGYSALIPDIESSQGRIIEMKESSPADDKRISESEFETNLINNNPDITTQQISNIKSGFSLTSTFYDVDTSKFSNSFVEIADLGINITNYSDQINPFWITNTSSLIGSSNLYNIDKPRHLKDLRSDSFIISSFGYTFSDNSINDLENIYDQTIKVQENSINQDIQIGNKEITSNKIAIRISPTNDIKVKSFKIRIKKYSEYINPDSFITAEIWSSKNSLPFEKLCVGSKIYLDNINPIYQEKEFFVNYYLFKNKEYWVVLNSNNLPPKYDLNVGGLISINDNSITGVFNQKNNTYTNFSKYNLGAKVGIGTNVPTDVTTWFPITSIGSSNSMVVSGAGITQSKQNYSIKYDYLIGIQEASSIGASTNMAYFSGTAWTADNGTAYINFFSDEAEIYAAFNRDFDNSRIILPSSNKYRESIPDYFVNEHWSFKVKEFENDLNLYLYPRSVTLNQKTLIANGTSGNNYVSIGQSVFSEKVLGGMLITHSSIPVGTAISYIYHDSSNSDYKIYLTNNLSGSINQENVYVGITTSYALRRTQDIHCAIRYISNGGLATTTIVLEKSPTWITYWNKSNRYNYSVVDKSIKSDLISATYNLNYENYKPFHQIKFVNGYSLGHFVPKASLGTTFDFRFTSSYGLKVFVDGSATPSVDMWKNATGTGFTFSKVLSNVSQPIDFEIQFYNLSSSIGQTLKAEWRKSGTTTWQDLDDSFYQDVIPQISLITTDKIKRISYISVGNTSEVTQSPYFGAPQTDKLVLRSK